MIMCELFWKDALKSIAMTKWVHEFNMNIGTEDNCMLKGLNKAPL